MNQKVTLIGLLTFIDRGSILQALLGLIVSAVILCMMLSEKPYVQSRTNILAISGQLMIAIAYLSAVLLRVNLEGERFDVDTIGWVMIGSQAPMVGYLLFDMIMTVMEELHHARVDILAAELGKIGQRYRCTEEGGVGMQLRMIKPDTPKTGILGSVKRMLGKKSKEEITDIATLEIGRIQEGEIVTVNAQAVVFQDGGAVARMHKEAAEGEDGWFSYNHHGLTGKRHFELEDRDAIDGMLVGKVHMELRRSIDQLRINLIRINWSKEFLIEQIGQFADEDEKQQPLFCLITVNRDEQRTFTESFMEPVSDAKGPSWNSGIGQAMLYDLVQEDKCAVLESIMIKVFKAATTAVADCRDPHLLRKFIKDKGTHAQHKVAHAVPKDTFREIDELKQIAAEIRLKTFVKEDANHDEHEFLGFCMMDLGDRIQKEEWVWNAVDLEAGELRQRMIYDGTKLEEETDVLDHSTGAKHHVEPHTVAAQLDVEWNDDNAAAAAGKEETYDNPLSGDTLE
jgi:hypothetical protein